MENPSSDAAFIDSDGTDDFDHIICHFYRVIFWFLRHFVFVLLFLTPLWRHCIVPRSELQVSFGLGRFPIGVFV